MSAIKINGISLNVNVTGEGDPLLLIHGIGMDSAQWNNTVDKYSRSFKVITYDCRGHGKSDKPASYMLKDHVLDAIALMDALGLQNVNLYGASAGSYIAQGAAIAETTRIRRLILAVPKSNGLTSSVQRIYKEHAKEIEKLDGREKEAFIFKFMAYNPEILMGRPELIKSTLTPAQSLAANKALEGFDYRADLHRITAKTLVISGKYDGLNPPSEGRLCSSLIPNATYVEMQYSGHLPMVEEADLYDRIIAGFLQG